MPGGHGPGGRPAIVVTSINAPGEAMRALAAGASAHGQDLIVVGDTKSPADCDLTGVEFFDIAAQLASGLAFARSCPTAITRARTSAICWRSATAPRCILETDDDNIPLPSFFAPRERAQAGRRSPRRRTGSTSTAISPMRGSGRADCRWSGSTASCPRSTGCRPREVDCPIQQGLANANPDVDAIYRLVLPLPQDFRGDRRVALAPRHVVPVQQPEHDLVAGCLSAAVLARLLLVPHDRHLAQLRRPAHRRGERLARPVPRADGRGRIATSTT